MKVALQSFLRRPFLWSVPMMLALAAPAAADDAAIAEFYEGKQVKLLVSFGAGGGYDIFTRVVGRHLPKHLPGHPDIVVLNMPGAGGLRAANALYRGQPNDGTVLSTMPPNAIMAAALGANVQFDARKFNWLGAGSSDFIACGVRTDGPVRTVQGAMKTEIPIAAQAPGSLSYAVPQLLNAVIHTKFKVVAGYGSVPEQFLAVKKNEATGTCQAYQSVYLATQSDLLSGANPEMKLLVGLVRKMPKGPYLDGVPTAASMAKDETQRKLLRVVGLMAEMAYPYAMGPNVPAERVAAVRVALEKTFRDPEFIKEAERAGQAVAPHTAEDVAEAVDEMLSISPDMAERLRPLLLRRRR